MMGAITNVLFNFILIPRYGIEGAAVATLLTQMLANLVFPSFFKDTRGFSRIAINGIFLKDILVLK
jgi:O-antigen/teichoic acid export membrane protein